MTTQSTAMGVLIPRVRMCLIKARQAKQDAQEHADYIELVGDTQDKRTASLDMTNHHETGTFFVTNK